jgi:ubiquinol-cytochrome c reductase cytochrome c subunit
MSPSLRRDWRRPSRVPRPLRMAAAAACAAGALMLWSAPAPAPAQGTSGTQPGARAPLTKFPFAPGPGAETVPTVTSPRLIAEGQALFDQRCASCHGLNLQGRRGIAPSLEGVGAGPVDFYLSTGRMPLANYRAQPWRERPAFNRQGIQALIAYIRHRGGGPPAPTADPARGSLARGFQVFDENCAGCHSIVARGGITVGAQVPDLQSATPQQIAEAVRMGPYLMPHFDAQQIDQHDLNSLARYILWTRHPANLGGWGIYNIGPIPEGIVAWFLGLLALVIVARLIGERTT